MSRFFSHPRCYAAKLGDCSAKISREHYISRTVLARLAVDGLVDLTGLPWQEGRTIGPLPPTAFTGKILCQAQNERLSPLDEAGKAFLEAFDRAHEHLNNVKGVGDAVVRVDGPAIERWLLKMLSGLVASGNAAKNDKAFLALNPPLDLLRILFGLDVFPHDWGLYCRNTAGQKLLRRVNTFKFAPLIKDAEPVGVPYGCIAELFMFSFLLVMNPTPDRKGIEGATYRPVAFEFYHSGESRTAAVVLNWGNSRGDGRQFTVKYSPESGIANAR